MPEEQLLAADEIDLREYFRILRKRRWVVALVTALAVATSGVLSFLVLPPVYEARATILVANAVNPQQQRVTPNDAVGLEGIVNYLARLPQLTINTYVSQLTSENMLKRAAKAMNLDPAAFPVDRLARMVQAKAVKDTNLIQITVSDTDAALATELANVLTREFLKFVSETNQDQLGRSVQFLEEQVKVVERDLAQARKKLSDFDSQPRGVDFLALQLKTVSEDLNRYQTQARQAQVDITLLAAGLASAEEALARTPREVTVATEGGGQRTELNPAWSELARLAEGRRVELAQKRAEAAALGQAIAMLEKDLKSLQAELASRRAERERLQAEADRLAQTRDLLAGKITETRIARSVDLGQVNIEVISPALQPAKPVKPRKALNLAVALILGLMGGVALAFLMEHLDNTIKTTEDVERELGLPVLGSIPAMSAADLRR